MVVPIHGGDRYRFFSHLRHHPMLFNPLCPLSTARILALRATVLLLLSLLIRAKLRIAAFSALGIVLLALQTLLVLAAAAGAFSLAAAAAGLYASQQRRPSVSP